MNLAGFLDQLGDVPWSRAPADLKRKSKAETKSKKKK